MNNFIYPFPNNNNYFNLVQEIFILKNQVKTLEEKVKKLENTEENDYLKDDGNYYMI